MKNNYSGHTVPRANYVPMRTLKLFFFLFLFFQVLCLNAQSEKFTLNSNKITIGKLFKEVKKQTKLDVIYNVSDINPDKSVTVNAKNESITSVLDKVFSGTNVTYVIDGKYIVFSVKSSPRPAKTVQPSGKNRVVKGKVTDAAGEALIGVNVQLKGTSNGVMTDMDGNFQLTVQGKGDLLFSYIGYKQVLEPLTDGKSVINVTMKEDSKLLDEVVVTAMGIERAAKSLTYATQTVGGAELTRAKDANFINSLQGKSAGLVITPNAGGAGSASKILLRGNSSIIGENSPLIVVDGIPMQNKVEGQYDGTSGGGYKMAYASSSEGGDALSNINPDDIESVTILKGANSAALYGKAAANGVIMITTKKGKEGKISIDVSSSSMFENPLVLPKVQNIFGGTINQNQLSASSWGKPLSEMTADELKIPGVTNHAQDMIGDFFQTGTNFNNSISFSGGSEKMQSYFSYGNTMAKGMIPSNKFNRHSLALRQSYNFLNKKLKLDLSMNYIHQKSNNRVSGGTVFNPLYNLYLAPRNLDMSYYKTFEKPGEWQSEKITVLYAGPKNVETTTTNVLLKGNMQNWFLGRGSAGENNPYWLNNRVTNETTTKHFYGTAGLTYSILDGLSAQARLSYDRTDTDGDAKIYATTVAREGTLIDRGQYSNSNESFYDIFTDYLLSYNKKVSDYNLSGSMGFSFDKKRGENFWMRNSGATSYAYYTQDDIKNIPTSINVFQPDASYATTRTYSVSSDWSKALFMTGSVGYKEMVYLDASYRMDWARAFTQFKYKGVKDHFGYYSVGANALLNEIFKMGEQVNRFKVRFSYSEVGNSVPNILYSAQKVNNGTGGVVAVDFTDWDPKPETMRSTEFGVDLGLFRNTLDVNLTLYNSMSFNQYLPTTSATGAIKPINSGKVRNRGLETTVAYTFTPSRNFFWKTGVNFSYNENKILQTFKHRKDIYIGIGTSDNLKVKFLEGGSYGDLYSKDFDRYNKFEAEEGLGKEGDIKLDPQGNPSLRARGGHSRYLGNMNAKVNLGWNNTFDYKGISLYVLIDGKIGGKVISFTEAYLDKNGVSERSAKARMSNLTWTDSDGKKYPAVVMPDGNLAAAEKYYSTIGSQIFASEYVYDATNFRLRELSLGYTFKNLLGASTRFSVSAVARNLFFLYKQAPVDPDVSLSTANALGGVDIFGLPSSRSIGLNLKLSF